MVWPCQVVMLMLMMHVSMLEPVVLKVVMSRVRHRLRLRLVRLVAIRLHVGEIHWIHQDREGSLLIAAVLVSSWLLCFLLCLIVRDCYMYLS